MNLFSRNRTRYCTACGSPLAAVVTQKGFDERTGKPAMYRDWRCPNADAAGLDRWAHIDPFIHAERVA